MSEEWQARQELLTGEEKLCKLAKSRVAVIGLGGVGVEHVQRADEQQHAAADLKTGQRNITVHQQFP